MSDHFKKFVEEHRSEFEQHQEDYQALWQEIESKLPLKKRSKVVYINFLWKAAAVLLLITSSALFLKMRMQQNKLPDQLTEAATHYSPLIAEKMEVLQAHQPEVGSQVIADLEVLDDAFEELRHDLADDANNEEVVEAMIQNYRIKLEVLEHILDEIQNKDDDENNQKGTSL